MTSDASYARMLFALPTDAEPTAQMIDIGVRIRSRVMSVQRQAVTDRLRVNEGLRAESTTPLQAERKPS